VEHTIRRRLSQLGEGIVAESWNRASLGCHREHLAQQRIVRVTPADPRDETPWYPHLESTRSIRCCGQSAVVELHEPQKLINIGHGLRQDSSPVSGRPGFRMLSHGGTKSRSFAMIDASDDKETEERWLLST
jgi:hypothetical protein